jgi:hypothetical protein
VATTTDKEQKKSGKAAYKELSKIALEVGTARRRASMRPNAKGRVIQRPDHRLARSRIAPRPRRG